MTISNDDLIRERELKALEGKTVVSFKRNGFSELCISFDDGSTLMMWAEDGYHQRGELGAEVEIANSREG